VGRSLPLVVGGKVAAVVDTDYIKSVRPREKNERRFKDLRKGSGEMLKSGPINLYGEKATTSKLNVKGR